MIREISRSIRKIDTIVVHIADNGVSAQKRIVHFATVFFKN